VVYSLLQGITMQTNSPAQAEQTAPAPTTAPAKVMPDFSHRLACDYEPNCPDALVHDVETMLMRSKGMLNILSDLHLETHLNQINSDI
jgi:hypothetical protein